MVYLGKDAQSAQPFMFFPFTLGRNRIKAVPLFSWGKHEGGKGKDKYMIVVYAATRNLYEPLRITMRSLLAHNRPEMIYILAEDDALPYDIDAPHKVINVSGQTYFKPDGANANSVFTYMAMMRLLYVDLMPDVDKVLQLDVDTVVCEDLTPLWNIDLTGLWCACVPEYMSNYKPYHMQYYNVGVALINLAQLRADHIVPLMIEDLNINRYPCIEQDVINKYGVPLRRVVGLPVRFNDSFCCGHSENPAIVHYAGSADWFTNKNVLNRGYLERYLDG